MTENHKIVVTGHAYAHPQYFRVFEYADKDRFVFVLPKIWKAKLNIKLEKRPGFIIYGLRAWSYGSKSFLGGPWKGWLPGLAYLLPYLRVRYGVKVLYSCSEPNLLTTLFNGCLAKLLGMKLVLFTWQNIAPEVRMRGTKLKLSNLLVKINLKLSDGIICGNTKAREIIRKWKMENGKWKILVCPLSGVDVEKFKPDPGGEWRKKLGIGSEKIILFYGALDNRKGVDVLIRAFQKLDIDAKLIIVGSGPNKDKLEALAKNLGLHGNTFFINWMENTELPKLLNDADVFVYPSVPSGGWEEQFGYALAEAGACQVPVVSTNIGSIEEVVKDGVTGILVPPNNPEVLVSAIYRLLSDQALNTQMGEAGRRYVISNYSHQAVVEKITNFILQII